MNNSEFHKRTKHLDVLIVNYVRSVGGYTNQVFQNRTNLHLRSGNKRARVLKIFLDIQNFYCYCPLEIYVLMLGYF